MAIASTMNKSSKEACCIKAKVTKSKKSKASKVSFADVTVRMYPVTLGASPGGMAGPPLCLSWNYTSLGKATVEDFEQHRKDPQFKRRNLQALHISVERRVALLRSAGFTDRQIHAAAREAARVRMERRRSVQEVILKCRAKKAEQQAALAKAQQTDLQETDQAVLFQIDTE